MFTCIVLYLSLFIRRSGIFLVQISEQCSRLESLRLKDLGPSAVCCYSKHLAQALQHFTALKDLRVEQNNFAPCREVFQAITTHCTKLERLVLISPTPSYQSYNIKDMTDLVKSISTLVFALLNTAYITETNRKVLKRTVRKLQRCRPALVVLCTLSADERLDRSLVPLSHLTEMVDTGSWARQHNVRPLYK